MARQSLCLMRDVCAQSGAGIHITDFQLNIKESLITALVSEDGSGDMLLRIIACLKKKQSGTIEYTFEQEKLEKLSKYIQYVPDDIVCYTNMKVKDFIQGFIYTHNGKDAVEEAIRLCEIFEIDMEEMLLNMTFEQNRLVAMIQALAMKPALLLLNRPYDLLSLKAYRLLLKELERLRQAGTAIVIAADAYDKIIIPCEDYIFFKDGCEYARYRANELPRPAKVIALDGGNLDSMLHSKMKELYHTKNKCCFLYKEEDVGELVTRIHLSGCYNFTVNELSMEEEIFENYERWMP